MMFAAAGVRSRRKVLLVNLSLACLSIAIGFSWLGCVSTFATDVDNAPRRVNLATGAAAVCIAAIGLAAASDDRMFGALVLLAGLAIAYTIGMTLRPMHSFLLSAAGLAIYLQGMGS